jgi:type II secretory pathway pseudopilin PulG
MVYLLIGLAIMAAILAVVRPKIQEFQDKALIDRSRDVIQTIDERIFTVYDLGVGNRRNIEIEISNGVLTIDSQANNISFELEDSRMKYSQPGEDVPIGNLFARTEDKGNGFYDVKITRSYSNVDILLGGDTNATKGFSAAPSPYKFAISNEGTGVNIESIS